MLPAPLAAPAPAPQPLAATRPVPAPAPVTRPAPAPSDDHDDDDVYEDFEPNKVPIILLVLLIVALVGYFGVYLPTRDDGDSSPLGDVPGSDEGGIGDAPTASVAVALAEHHPYGITVEL
jgi:hypothetical protein